MFGTVRFAVENDNGKRVLHCNGAVHAFKSKTEGNYSL